MLPNCTKLTVSVFLGHGFAQGHFGPPTLTGIETIAALGLCPVRAGMRLCWGHDPYRILAFFTKSVVREGGWARWGRSLDISAPPWAGDVLRASKFVPFLMATNKHHNGLKACMARKPCLPDTLQFNRTLNIGIYFKIHSSIKYLSSIYYMHDHLHTTRTQRWGKDIPWP